MTLFVVSIRNRLIDLQIEVLESAQILRVQLFKERLQLIRREFGVVGFHRFVVSYCGIHLSLLVDLGACLLAFLNSEW